MQRPYDRRPIPRLLMKTRPACACDPTDCRAYQNAGSARPRNRQTASRSCVRSAPRPQTRAGASHAAGGESSRALAPASVISPLTSNRSFTEIGSPATSERASPPRSDPSKAAAASRCAYRKPYPGVMPHRNRLSWQDDRAVLLRSGRPGIAIQVEGEVDAENAVLRHQLIVLKRNRRGRARLTNHDRLFFIQLYRWFPSILQAVTIIRPETLVRWHRAGFRGYWRWKSRPLGGRPQIDNDWLQTSLCQGNGKATRI